jgi:hypothetical protein
MELTALTETEAIDAAFEQLMRRIRQGATEVALTLLIPAHPHERKAYWHERERIWATPQTRVCLTNHDESQMAMEARTTIAR